MARPKPIVIDCYENVGYNKEETLKATVNYVVCKGLEPFNLRMTWSRHNRVDMKYRKVTFTNPAHAFRLAERLNALYGTHEYCVRQIIIGDIIIQED